MNQGEVISIVVVGVAATAAVGYYFYQKQKNTSQAVTVSSTPTPTGSGSSAPILSTGSGGATQQLPGGSQHASTGSAPKRKLWVFANSSGKIVYRGYNYQAGLAKAGGYWKNNHFVKVG